METGWIRPRIFHKLNKSLNQQTYDEDTAYYTHLTYTHRSSAHDITHADIQAPHNKENTISYQTTSEVDHTLWISAT
jgi:hypothetical protein